MKCVVGLGNPGRKYSKTRHNIGFMVIDELAGRHRWKLKKDKFKGRSTVETSDGEKVILLKPQTFMNLSGESVRPVMDFYQIAPENVLVIYDDLDLPAGKIRLRQKGGHGGHNGIRSIIDHLGTKEFKRLRIGIGRPAAAIPVVDYVLQSFSSEQQDDVESGIKKSADACETWLQKPFAEVMNEFNS
ncbi:peptidyl-tRNA hydrolase [Lentibacillus halodurans]|uniref:Peptidyl-tRNA hydrolase n=1 Tax=Lentibacillus halodurans TaxID=237679 RepID=A0A1I1A5J7_9BACI|nr:aminoacyl-tRNA hydrolase [Lentibacillus halodurans]SFB31693.1 peptidyl-tRNA hydrolase [Lentibacillus halodurans]